MRRAGLYKELLSLRGLLADYEETANRESSRTAQKSEEAMASGFSMGSAGSASSSAVPTVDMSALDKSESECRLFVSVRDIGSASSSLFLLWTYRLSCSYCRQVFPSVSGLPLCVSFPEICTVLVITCVILLDICDTAVSLLDYCVY